MIRLGLMIAIWLVAVLPASAKDARFKAMLKTLDPDLRLEQVCDAEAMKKIGRDRNSYRPDRALIGATARPHIDGDIVQGSGGAFRSRGKWYEFSFTCHTAPDRLSVLSFDYRVGEPIPEEKWQDYGLWR